VYSSVQWCTVVYWYCQGRWQGLEEDEDAPTPPVLLSFALIGVDLLA